MPAVDFWSLFGQFLGLVAVVLGFLTYQMRTPRQLLLIQTVTCVVFCAHYFLIGATSGLVLNAVGVVRNIVYYNRDKKLFSGAYVPYVFALIMLVLGIFTWQSWYSLLVIVGLAINTVCMSLQDAQKIRKSILVSSPLVLLYNVLSLSIGGIIFEAISIVSAIIGIFRNRKQ